MKIDMFKRIAKQAALGIVLSLPLMANAAEPKTETETNPNVRYMYGKIQNIDYAANTIMLNDRKITFSPDTPVYTKRGSKSRIRALYRGQTIKVGIIPPERNATSRALLVESIQMQ